MALSLLPLIFEESLKDPYQWQFKCKWFFIIKFYINTLQNNLQGRSFNILNLLMTLLSFFF